MKVELNRIVAAVAALLVYATGAQAANRPNVIAQAKAAELAAKLDWIRFE